MSNVILGHFEKNMEQKQSMAILVNYKDNNDMATIIANKSLGFDLSAIQSCFPMLLGTPNKFRKICFLIRALLV